tara:strand:+ start:106 stop:1107 length:1002 start_codon:yes stop_codon:yes gene_type:complete
MSKKIYTIQSSDKEEFEKQVNDLLELGFELMDGGYQLIKEDGGFIYSQIIVIENGKIEFYDNKQLKYIKKNGLEIKWYENGQRSDYRINIYGYKEGKWTNWYENGQKKCEREYKNSGLVGPYNEWYKNGQIKTSGKYEYDLFNYKIGLFTSWYENGKKESEERYKNNKKNGIFTSWYENGELKEITTWENEIKNGNYERYYENGQLEIEGCYKNGVQYIQNKYNRNNEIEVKNGYGLLKYKLNLRPYLEKKGLTSKIESPIKNGTKNGISTSWYGNGEVKQTTTWEDGILNGPSVEYDKSGKVKSKGNYKNGQKYGEWKSYDEDGGCFTYNYE